MSRSSNPFQAFTKLPVMPDLSVVPTWTTAAMQIAQKSATIAVASQQVIAMRLTMLATKPGQSRTNRESHRMVSEKVDAVQESAVHLAKLATSLATTWPKLWTDPKAANRTLHQIMTATNRAVTPFSRRVSSNARRLSR